MFIHNNRSTDRLRFCVFFFGKTRPMFFVHLFWCGAERRGGVLCAGPAYVVIPQAKKSKTVPMYLKTGPMYCCCRHAPPRAPAPSVLLIICVDLVCLSLAVLSTSVQLAANPRHRRVPAPLRVCCRVWAHARCSRVLGHVESLPYFQS
jgi:hypothetical protein